MVIWGINRNSLINNILHQSSSSFKHTDWETKHTNKEQFLQSIYTRHILGLGPIPDKPNISIQMKTHYFSMMRDKRSKP